MSKNLHELFANSCFSLPFHGGNGAPMTVDTAFRLLCWERGVMALLGYTDHFADMRGVILMKSWEKPTNTNHTSVVKLSFAIFIE